MVALGTQGFFLFPQILKPRCTHVMASCHYNKISDKDILVSTAVSSIGLGPWLQQCSAMEHVLWCLYLKQKILGREGRESEHERVPHPFWGYTSSDLRNPNKAPSPKSPSIRKWLQHLPPTATLGISFYKWQFWGTSIWTTASYSWMTMEPW